MGNWYKSLIKLAGEYWIMDGRAVEADGDIGDSNHNTVVLETILSQHDIEYDNWTDLTLQDMQQAGMSTEEIQVVQYMQNAPGAKYDPRRYGMEHLGWKRVMGNNITTWTLTQRDANAIYNGTDDLYYDSEGDGNPSWNIEVVSTNQTYFGVPESVLEMAAQGDLYTIQKYLE